MPGQPTLDSGHDDGKFDLNFERTWEAKDLEKR